MNENESRALSRNDEDDILSTNEVVVTSNSTSFSQNRDGSSKDKFLRRKQNTIGTGVSNTVSSGGSNSSSSKKNPADLLGRIDHNNKQPPKPFLPTGHHRRSAAQSGKDRNGVAQKTTATTSSATGSSSSSNRNSRFKLLQLCFLISLFFIGAVCPMLYANRNLYDFHSMQLPVDMVTPPKNPSAMKSSSTTSLRRIQSVVASNAGDVKKREAVEKGKKLEKTRKTETKPKEKRISEPRTEEIISNEVNKANNNQEDKSTGTAPKAAKETGEIMEAKEASKNKEKNSNKNRESKEKEKQEKIETPVKESSSPAETGKQNKDELTSTEKNDKVVAKKEPLGKYAYAYVVGGCDPDQPAYRNYIYDIMVSTYNQRVENSTADVIVLFQMSYNSSYTELPEQDVRILNAMDIRIQYIPKTKDESFYRIMLDKFRILNLTQYDRVLFLDSDVMVMGNMDYLMEISMQGVTKKNLVLAGKKEPANGGTFMLAPHEGAWDRILKVIEDKEERGAKLPYPHWDETVGWGHEIDPKRDYYQFANGQKATKWNFYGAFADQGLLYHWAKYEDKSLSIVFKDKIQNWDVGADGKTVELQETIKIDVYKDLAFERQCWKGNLNHAPCQAPHSDFVHFTGRSKPWLGGPPEDFETADPWTSSKYYWFHSLSIVNKKINMGLDLKKWKKHKRPLLGMYPKHNDAAGMQYKSTVTDKEVAQPQ